MYFTCNADKKGIPSDYLTIHVQLIFYFLLLYPWFCIHSGTPLFNEMTGEAKDRLTYLTEKFPSKPWEGASSSGKTDSEM